MTTATYAMRRNQNLYRQRTQVRMGPVSVSFVMIAIISLLALLYLTQITKTNAFGARVAQLHAQLLNEQTNQQQLQVEAARLQAIQQIQSSSVVSKMVPEGQPVYAAAQ